MMFLLLTTFFPALLAIVAMYIIFAGIGDVLPAFGLNTLAGLILAYLGGALGANVWLLKGYFDTVPRELDEAAIVDGASHARIFFTMTLRLVMPILVTVFMLVFVGLYGEFMLASVFLTDVDNQTLGVGLYGMTLGNDANTLFGRFTAGALLGSHPRHAALPRLPASARRRPHHGIREVTPCPDPPADVAEPAAPRRVGAVRLQPDAPPRRPRRRARPGAARGRGRGRPRAHGARTARRPSPWPRKVRTTAADDWWRATLTCHNPVTNYRFLLTGGPTKYAWLNGTGVHERDVPDASDFRLVAHASPPPDVGAGVGRLPDLPRPLRALEAGRQARDARLGDPGRVVRPGRPQPEGGRATSSTAVTSTASPSTSTTSSRSASTSST